MTQVFRLLPSFCSKQILVTFFMLTCLFFAVYFYNRKGSQTPVFKPKEEFRPDTSCTDKISRRQIPIGDEPRKVTYLWAMEHIYTPFNYSLDPDCTTHPWLSLLKKNQYSTQFCDNIFTSWIKKNQQKAVNPPMKLPPKSMIPYFTMNGSIKIVEAYLNNFPNNSEPLQWNRKNLEWLVNSVRMKQPTGYGNESLKVYKAIDTLNLTGKRVAVIGTLTPWVEAIMLAANVASVTTIEYAKIIIKDQPKVTHIFPLDAAKQSIAGNLEPFDFIASYSSIEHSGLGRYGDVVNPNADLMEMQKCWCWLKPGGYMLLGLPVGWERVRFNTHRVYGPLRLPLMTAGFEVIDVFDSNSRMKWSHLKDDQFIFESDTGQQNAIILRKKDEKMSQ